MPTLLRGVSRWLLPGSEPDRPRPSWISPERRRIELRVLAGFVAANLIVPALTMEFFPFSRFWLFADAPQQYCEYEVRTPGGTLVPLMLLGLQRNYNGSQPGAALGRKLRPTIDRFGHVASEEAVRGAARSFLERHPGLRFVDVQQNVIGAVDPDRVGVVSTRRWRIRNEVQPD